MIKIFILGLLIVGLLTQQQSTTSIVKIELQKPHKETQAAEISRTYQLDIEKTHTSGHWNLFFVVEPQKRQFWENTEVIVYRVLPLGKNYILADCVESGVDACMVHRSNITFNDQIFINVSCKQHCQYTLNTYWSQTYPLKPSSPLRLDFEETAYAKLFSLNVQNQDFKELRILLKAQTFLEGTAPVNMYVNYGKIAPTASKHDFKGIHMWDDGQGLFLQKKDLKELKFTILIEGPAKNILNLEAVLLNEYKNHIGFMKPTFDHLKKLQTRTYYLDLTKHQNIKQNDIYIKASTFSGRIHVQIYRDEQLKEKIFNQPWTHLGDSQYKISKSIRKAENITDKIYISVKTTVDAESTYMLMGYYRSENYIKLLHQTTELSQLESKSIQFYYIQVYHDRNSKQPILSQISMNIFEGYPALSFSICNYEIQMCLPTLQQFTKNPQSYNTIKPKSESRISYNNVIYKFELDAEKFIPTENRKHTKMQVLIIAQNLVQQKSKYSITYIDHTIIRTLRQNHPARQRLSQGEEKYFKYINQDSSVKQIRIHLVQISGDANFAAYRIDPRQKELTSDPIYPVANVITISNKLTDPIYILVLGQQNAFISLTAQIIRDQTLDNDPKNKDTFNYLMLAQDVEHQMIIGPHGKQVLLLMPTSKEIEIELAYGGKLEFCGTTTDQKIPFPPNCEFNIKQKRIEKSDSPSRIFIGVTNPTDQNALLAFRYSNKYGCLDKKSGEVWNYNLQANLYYCVTYTFSRISDMNVLIHLANMKYKSLKVVGYLGNTTLQIDDSYTFIEKKYIDAQIAGATHGSISLLIQVSEPTNIQVVVQNTDKAIRLLDGLAQNVHGAFGSDTYKKFKFNLQYKKNTTIILESKVGYYSFFVNIVNYTSNEYHGLYPDKTKYNYSSKNNYYSLYNNFVLTEEQIAAAKCTVTCVALISVVSNNQETELRGHFVIEATQQIRFLREHSQAIGYLHKHSFAYYSYYYPNSAGSMVVSISSQNSNCFNIYLGKGEDSRPTGSNNIKQTIGQQLIANLDSPGIYAITLEAFQNCYYTISASSSNLKFYELTGGVFKDVELGKNEQAYFYYHHVFNESFKLISMGDEGQVLISANQTDRNQLQTLLSMETLPVNRFSWSKQHNVLRVSKTDRGFCSDCYYLFLVKATRNTTTSMIIYTKGLQIPLSNKKFVNDRLDQNQSIQFKIYENRKQLNLSINVLYGNITVSVVGIKNQTKSFVNTWNTTQIWILDQAENNGTFSYSLWQPTIVKITGNAASQYVFESISSEDPYDYKRLKLGLPTYIYVAPNEKNCAHGTITYYNMNAIISSSKFDKQKLRNVSITFSINNEAVKQLKYSIVQNSKLIQLDLNTNVKFFNIVNNYSLCFESKQGISLTVIPTSTISLLPEKSSYYVNWEQNFTMAPQGKFFLEVLECQGNSNVLMSSTFEKVKASQSQVNHWRKFGQSNIIEGNHWGPVYLNIEGEQALVRWMHINEQKGEGVGYFYYKIPHFKYRYFENQLIFQVEPLIQLAKQSPKFKLYEIKYTIILTQNLNKLKPAAQCNIGDDLIQKTQYINFSNKQNEQDLNNVPDEDEPITLKVDYDDIDSKFPEVEYIFVTVVAEATVITTSKGQLQNYKFIYDYQELPWNVEGETQKHTGGMRWTGWRIFFFIIFWITVASGIIFAIRFAYKKIIEYRNKKKLMAGSKEDIEMKYSDYTG